jgi:hypothetical protein
MYSQSPSSSSTNIATATSTPSVTPTSSGTPSSTSSFPIHVIIVPQPNHTDHTSLTSVYVSPDSQSTATSLYVLVSVNIILALGCMCCSLAGLCIICKIHRNRKEKMIIRTIVP